MSTWYKTSTYLETIESVEVSKETKTQITIAFKDWHGKTYERSRAKQSGSESFFPTWIEAYNDLTRRVEQDVENAENALAEAHKSALIVQDMRPPA